jgi:HSP90 family molecular chaperone
MKLADRTVETHSAGIKNESGFTIAQTSKMFKILSDSLYSDKVMAVIRELSTNAYDSHIASGNKNPFKVILPSAAKPNFVVRDYGTGLSQRDMESLYTTYGASNKNDSNDFVGCLGLGSKSPFAYTKSFTTSSYFNGQKYTYVAAV